MDSILASVKKLLGLSNEYEYFDDDIIMHINSAFSALNQLGIGSSKGFIITDETATWEDFIPGIKEDKMRFNNVKTYVYLKVRLVFDPPSSSVVMEAIKQQISELEWRLQVEGDSVESWEEEIQNGI